MAVYRYKAITQDGKTLKGIYEANSKDAVLVMLRQNEYYPVKIDERSKHGKIELKKLFSRISVKDVAVFCRQLQTMLMAGVNLISCLDILRQQTENKSFRTAIGSVYEKVQQGLTLSEAMRRQEKVFPELLMNMIAAGEASGNLDGILDRMAVHYEKESKIINKVRGAMVYPTVLAITAVLVVFILLVFVMPQFIGMFQDSGVQLPVPTRILLGISGFLKAYWYLAIAAAALFVVFIKALLKNEHVRYKFDSWKFRLPIIKGINQKVITSRFARTLATLLSSGMPLLQALDIVGKILDNKFVEQGIMKAKEDVSRGVLLSVPIKNMNLFPPMMLSMLSIGEESGAMDEILNRTANYYDDEAEVALESMTKLVEPIMLVVMALVIGFIVMSMILPMFDIYNTVAM